MPCLSAWNYRVYADGTTETTAYPYGFGRGVSESYPSFCGISVRKLRGGYLVGFYGHKLYFVDKEGAITEIGDKLKNMRLDFMKNINRASSS